MFPIARRRPAAFLIQPSSLGFLLAIPVPGFGRCLSLPLQGANPEGCRAGGMSDIAASP